VDNKIARRVTGKIDVSGSEVSLDPASLAALENITVTVDNEVEIKNDLNNPVPISNTDLAPNAATETTLASVLSAVDGIETLLGSTLTELGQKTEPSDAQNIRDLAFATDKVDVSGSSLVNISGTVSLPTGASTSANQATGNNSLSSIDSKVTGLALDSTLVQVRDSVDQIEGYLDQVEPLLTSIRDNADTVETLLTSIGSNTDGIETLITSSNLILTDIRNNADTVETLLASIGTNTDGLESLITSSNLLLTEIRDNADTVESLLTSLGSNTDGLEALITSSNGLLTSIRDNADQLEGYFDQVETILNQISTRIGDLTEAAPISDTASSGLNGRMQRIAQRLTSIITSLTDRSQKTQITNGTIDVAVSNSAPSLTDAGLVVRPLPLELNTYGAATNGFVSAASATDVFRIVGSGTKTVRITKLTISGRTTSGSPVACIIKVIKYSSANTAGTSVATTAVPLDSSYPAATATVNHYTANPTLGTAVGNIATRSITFQASGLVETLVFEFENPIVLRGTAQQLSINLNATTITGASICCDVLWEEI
jgi:ABC-type transporter Mla subunit MlaD